MSATFVHAINSIRNTEPKRTNRERADTTELSAWKEEPPEFSGQIPVLRMFCLKPMPDHSHFRLGLQSRFLRVLLKGAAFAEP